MRLKECPICGQDISESYEPADTSVGIMTGGWYCSECDIGISDDGESDDD